MPKGRQCGRICILVLGMHRSGTSALTRVVNLLGAALPKHLMGANEGNETGHWEPARLQQLHDRFLAEMGSAWHDWRPLDLAHIPAGRLNEFKAEAAGIVDAEYGDAPLFVIKEPRICRFTPFFIESLEETGVEIVPVIALRNPLEVIASLQNRSNWPAEYGAAEAVLLWLSHVLAAERATRGRPRAIIAYDSLLSDWKAAKRAIECGTGITFPCSEEEAATLIDEFLDKDQRHHARKAAEVAMDPVTGGWSSETYEAMTKLAANPKSTIALYALDRIREPDDGRGVKYDLQNILNDLRHIAESRANRRNNDCHP